MLVILALVSLSLVLALSFPKSQQPRPLPSRGPRHSLSSSPPSPKNAEDLSSLVEALVRLGLTPSFSRNEEFGEQENEDLNLSTSRLGVAEEERS